MKEDKTLRALGAPLDRPILLLMGCQKHLAPTRRASPLTKTTSRGLTLESTDFLTSAGWDRMLPPHSRRIFATWDVPEAAVWLAWLEAVVPVRPADRGMSTPAPLQPTGLFILCDRFPAPPPLSRIGTEGPRPPGLKSKLLVKRVGTGRENTHSDTHSPPPVYLMSGQLRGGKTTFSLSTAWPAFCPFTFCLRM